MKRALAVLLACLFLLPSGTAFATGGEAQEIATACTLANAVGEAAFLRDDSVKTHVRVAPGGSVRIETEGIAAFAALCWYALPGPVTIEEYGDAGVLLGRRTHQPAVLNETVPLTAGCKTLLLLAEGGFLLAGVHLFSAGTLPEEVEAWQVDETPTPLLLVAESVCGALTQLLPLLPIYQTERGLSVQVAVLCIMTRQEQQELLAALWQMGVRRYPVFGTFADGTGAKRQQIADAWGYVETRAFLVALLRDCRPLVTVVGTMDTAAGAFLTEQLKTAVLRAGDAAEFPGSMALGAWHVQKMYAAKDRGATVPDTAKPLAACSGASAADAARHAYTFLHTCRILHPVPQWATGYELLYSACGQDEARNDLFEHLTPAQGERVFVPLPSPSLVAEEPVPDDSLLGDGFRRAFDPPEYVSSDYEHAHWEYRSDTLSVFLDGYDYEGETAVFSYFVAEVRMRELDARLPAFGSISRDGHGKMRARTMAHALQAVLLISGDGLLTGKAKAAPLLRAGHVYGDDTGEAYLAFLADGGMRVMLPREASAFALAAMGVEDTYAAGPYLLHNGEENPDADAHAAANDRARAAIGMVEPGHYVIFVTDGGGSAQAERIPLSEVAAMLKSYGCTEAYNLTGGRSVNLLFLGESMNGSTRFAGQRITNTSGDVPIADALIFGRSALVPADPSRICDALGLSAPS